MYLKIYNSEKQLVNELAEGVAVSFCNMMWAKTAKTGGVKRVEIRPQFNGYVIINFTTDLDLVYSFNEVPYSAGYVDFNSVLHEYVRQHNNIAGGL